MRCSGGAYGRLSSTFHARLGRLIRYRCLGMGIVRSGDFARLGLLSTSQALLFVGTGAKTANGDDYKCRSYVTHAQRRSWAILMGLVGARSSTWRPHLHGFGRLQRDHVGSATEWLLARDGPGCLACRGLEMASGRPRLSLVCMDCGAAPMVWVGALRRGGPLLEPHGDVSRQFVCGRNLTTRPS